jgi:hypothetical protein
MTDLELRGFEALNSKVLRTVLPAMPNLARLHLEYLPHLPSALSSLRCLATEALASSLTDWV